jgi:phosphate-selective porin OprO and OprP
MGKRAWYGAVFAIFVMIIGTVGISRADSTSRLIDILVKKGILTREEAAAIEREAREEDKVQAPASAPVTGQPGMMTEKERASEGKALLKTADIEWGYSNGAYLKTADDRFSVKLNVGVEPLFTYDYNEDDTDSTSFRIRRARIYLSGNVAYPWLKYYTQITLEGASAALRDAYLKATCLKWLQPQLGQYKVPFDREFLISGFGLELVERSNASSEFSLQRDMGLQLGGELMASHLTFEVGIFNGSGANQNNVNTDYMYVGRVVWMPFDRLGYSQSAVDNPERPRLAVGLGLAYLPGLEPGERKTLAGRLGSTSVLPVDSDVFQGVADIAFAYKRVYFEGGYFYRNIDPNSQTAFGSQDAYGFYLQGGYFIVPKQFELAARYSFIDPDNPLQVSNNKQHEGTFGMNYYFYGHRLKAQADYTFRSTDHDPDDIHEHIFQGAMVLLY